MNRRIFIGIKVRPEIYPKIDSWRKRYRNLPLRWISNENLHITLIPPWYEDGKKVRVKVKEIGREVRGFRGFSLMFDKVGFGPTLRNPRLIWAEGEVPEELIVLKSKLENILQKKPEKREYKLHLTLASIKKRDYKMSSNQKINDKVFWKQTVSSFCLFESILSAKGAEYKVIKEFKIT